jgi:hypothetical protein
MSAWLTPQFVWFLGIALVGHGAAAALMSALRAHGLVAEARYGFAVFWVCGTAGLAALGWRQYGLLVLLPSMFSAGLSLLIAWMIAMGGERARPRALAARAAIGALLASLMLPVFMLTSLAMLGIDGL